MGLPAASVIEKSPESLVKVFSKPLSKLTFTPASGLSSSFKTLPASVAFFCAYTDNVVGIRTEKNNILLNSFLMRLFFRDDATKIVNLQIKIHAANMNYLIKGASIVNENKIFQS